MTLWRERWESFHNDPPPVLHHYTTAAGLGGIVNSERIRASHASYLNDATELVYARSVLTHVLADALKAAASQASRDFVQSWLSVLPDLPEAEVYVACFCEKQDLLSQWRGYAGATGGYSIGFYTPSWLDPARSPAVLRRIIYNEDDQDDWVRSLIEPAIQWLDKLSAGGDEDTARKQVPAILQQCFEDMDECFFCFKHPSFEEEQEWRIAYRPVRFPAAGLTPDRLFRVRDNLVVPYVDLLLPSAHPSYVGRLPISVVTLGPTAHPELATKSVVMLLRDRGYGTDVQSSIIPLRA